MRIPKKKNLLLKEVAPVDSWLKFKLIRIRSAKPFVYVLTIWKSFCLNFRATSLVKL
jgi:hypothetical protein